MWKILTRQKWSKVSSKDTVCNYLYIAYVKKLSDKKFETNLEFITPGCYNNVLATCIPGSPELDL